MRLNKEQVNSILENSKAKDGVLLDEEKLSSLSEFDRLEAPKYKISYWRLKGVFYAVLEIIYPNPKNRKEAYDTRYYSTVGQCYKAVGILKSRQGKKENNFVI